MHFALAPLPCCALSALAKPVSAPGQLLETSTSAVEKRESGWPDWGKLKFLFGHPVHHHDSRDLTAGDPTTINGPTTAQNNVKIKYTAPEGDCKVKCNYGVCNTG